MHIIAHDQTFGAVTLAHAGSRRQRLAGRGLSSLAVLFLLVDSAGKLFQVQPVIEGTVALGYPADLVVTLGVIQLLSVIAYVVSATSPLGAVLLTGYLGGAVATHLRVGSPLFTHILFPTYVGALLWGGLMLRDSTLRACLPVRRTS